MDTTTRHWFRCAVPDGPYQERRVRLLKDWAEFLAKSADVHFSIEISDGRTFCDLIYVGNEAPRQFATKLHIATGEEFQLLRTVDIRASEALKGPDETPAPAQMADAGAPAQVSLIITRAQRASLRTIGYSDEDIRNMTPAEAHRNLGLGDQSSG
jgi:hypothetical protein